LRETLHGIASEVSSRLELAMLLEVSIYPKPGNVHRARNHSETTFEHFLASAVACRSHFERAAEKGVLIKSGKISPEQAQVGSLVRHAVISMMDSQHGGNTSLGTILLLMPIAIAAGMTFTGRRLSLRRLRHDLTGILRSATGDDTVSLYEAISQAKPGGIGTLSELDVFDSGSKDEIIRLELNPLDVFRLAAGWDSICSEWVTSYRITFELGYPHFCRELSRTKNLNEAGVNTYLKILAEIPDTLIARKAGPEKALWVSRRAKKAVAMGGLSTKVGRRNVERLDDELRRYSNLLNPGATADILASILALATLSGYRP
jgi:triphosphoribosyl-dephospho-CoA synthase